MTIVTTPTTSPPSRNWPPEQSEWTYEDWLRLPDDNFRYEVLNGELFMAPPPRFNIKLLPARCLP